MPYAKHGLAVSHYLEIMKMVAEKYGNPFRMVDLDEEVVLGGKTYSRGSIRRYISWAKQYYREKGLEPPFEIRYARDSRRGRVMEVYVDMDRIDEHIEMVRRDTGRKRVRHGLVKRKFSVEVVREKLTRCVADLEKCREELDRNKKELGRRMKELERMEKRLGRIQALLRKTLGLTVPRLQRCIEDIDDEADECILVRAIIEKALRVDKDNISAFDIAVTAIDKQYIDKLKKQVDKLRKKYL